MYTEDIDLCYKVKSAGYINYYTGSCSVIHHGGGSSHKRKENSFANVQIRESIFKFLKKTHGEIYAVLYKISMFLAALIRFCIIALAFIPCMLMGRRSSCGASLTKWMNILRWSLGITKWAR
jgi:GT2 family glycosyltransferase